MVGKLDIGISVDIEIVLENCRQILYSKMKYMKYKWWLLISARGLFICGLFIVKVKWDYLGIMIVWPGGVIVFLSCCYQHTILMLLPPRGQLNKSMTAYHDSARDATDPSQTMCLTRRVRLGCFV